MIPYVSVIGQSPLSEAHLEDAPSHRGCLQQICVPKAATVGQSNHFHASFQLLKHITLYRPEWLGICIANVLF